MTILQDECKPTQPTPSDAVVELMADEIAAQLGCSRSETARWCAEAILSALSDAGLAVLPLEETKDMLLGAVWNEGASKCWRTMATAFHSSQLEKTDE